MTCLVPTLTVALKLPLRYAIGTSLFVVVVVSAVGLVSHLVAGGHLDVGVTASLAGACMVGALTGAPLAQRVAHTALARTFAMLVAAVAVYLLVAVAFLGGPPKG